MSDPYRYFRIEAGEILGQLQGGLLELERGVSAALVVPRLLRLAHTLKGAARVVKQRGIADFSHTIEDFLVPIRDDRAAVSAATIAGALSSVDAARAELLALPPALSSSENARVVPPTVLLEEAFWSAKPDYQDLDALTNGITELGFHLASIRHFSEALERAAELAELLSAQLAPGRLMRVGATGQSKLSPLAEQLHSMLRVSERELRAGLDQGGRELVQVRDAALRLRLVPADLMWGSLERTARDAALSLGKGVHFEAHGGSIRLDADLLGLIQRALMQAVRNAVAHGIESPAARVLAGKPAEGRVTVVITRRDKLVEFSCRDDGGGLDLEAIRRSATRRGIAADVLAGMDAEALGRLLLDGGISTSGSVTGLAGRGIGLDLVRETAEKLSGDVTFQSQAQGTTLTITVPVSVSALSALLVEAGGEVLAIPISAVRSTARYVKDALAHGVAGETVLIGEQVVPYVALTHLLGVQESSLTSEEVGSVALIEAEAGVLAVGVSRLLGVESIVARSLPELLAAAPLIAGAALDADGNPRLLLSPDGLIRASRGAPPKARVSPRRPLPILVIDDSLTTRMLEQSILESAGYEVDSATSGEEGLKRAKRRKYALFLVDVEMPGMDGFTFIERAKQDPELADVPAILVTSRASEKDLQRGLLVGARAHIQKSEFNQTDLLARIATLVS